MKKILTIITCVLFTTLIVACTSTNNSPDKSNSEENINSAESVDYEALAEPTGYKRGSLVFYYFKIEDSIYTSSSEEVNSADEVWKVQGSKGEVNTKLQDAGYEKLGEVESTIDDIPEENL